MTPQEARGALAKATREDFLTFLSRAFAEFHQGANLEIAWPLEAITAQIERVDTEGGARLIINMPPRSLKSFTVSVAWVAWSLGRNPGRRFVCASYSAELANKHGRDCRALMQAAWYRDTFPQTRLARVAEHDLSTTARGGRIATSVDGTITGLGGDVIIIDDPLKPGEVASAAARTRVKEWFSETLQSRLDNKRTGSIILVMQRVHEDDLAGHLLEAGGWDHLRLPAIADEDADIPLTRGRLHRRREGEVLDPTREPSAILESMRAAQGSAVFAAQYQQDPVPAGGTIVKHEWLSYYATIPKKMPGDRIVQSWDCASKAGVRNDWSVCVTALVRRRTIFIIDVYRSRLDFPDLRDAVIRLARHYACEQLLIEDAASGQQLIQLLKQEEPSGVPRPIGFKPVGDKISRLEGATARFENGEVMLPIEAPWLVDFKHELLSFPNGKYDDQVDAVTQLISQQSTRHESVIPHGGFIIHADDPLDAEIYLEEDEGIAPGVDLELF